MKNIYHIHQSSNSYWESHWTDTDYYLCDTEEEYQQKLAEYKKKREDVVSRYEANTWQQNTVITISVFIKKGRYTLMNIITHMNGAEKSLMPTDLVGTRT